MNDFLLSKGNIKFLSNLYRIGNLLALNPVYSFKRNCLTHPTTDKIYSVINLLFQILMFVYTMRENYERSVDDLLTNTILDFTNDFFLMIHVFAIIICANILNQPSWIKLNENFQYIDKKFNTTNEKVKKWYHAFYLNIFVNFVYYLFVDFYAIFTVNNIFPFHLFTTISFWSHQMWYFYEYFIFVFIYNILSAFEYRYKKLNKRLVEFCSQPLIHSEANVIVFIRKIGFHRRILDETVNLFNKLFGWSLMFLIGRKITQLLISLDFILTITMPDLFVHSKIKPQVPPLAVWLIISTMFVTGYMIVMACDSVSKEGLKLIALCQKLQEQFSVNSNARKELYLLMKQVKYAPVIFSAADFFDINKSTLFGIIGATITYFIIIVQFNMSFHK